MAKKLKPMTKRAARAALLLAIEHHAEAQHEAGWRGGARMAGDTEERRDRERAQWEIVARRAMAVGRAWRVYDRAVAAERRKGA